MAKRILNNSLQIRIMTGQERQHRQGGLEQSCALIYVAVMYVCLALCRAVGIELRCVRRMECRPI
jgi:hypothetical protein